MIEDTKYYQILKEFTEKLEALRSSNDLPNDWFECLKNDTRHLKSRGRKPDPDIVERDIKIAIRMYKYRLENTKNISNFSEDLAEEYGIDRANIFKAENKYINEAIARIIYENLSK